MGVEINPLTRRRSHNFLKNYYLRVHSPRCGKEDVNRKPRLRPYAKWTLYHPFPTFYKTFSFHGSLDVVFELLMICRKSWSREKIRFPAGGPIEDVTLVDRKPAQLPVRAQLRREFCRASTPDFYLTSPRADPTTSWSSWWHLVPLSSHRTATIHGKVDGRRSFDMRTERKGLHVTQMIYTNFR